MTLVQFSRLGGTETRVTVVAGPLTVRITGVTSRQGCVQRVVATLLETTVQVNQRITVYCTNIILQWVSRLLCTLTAYL